MRARLELAELEAAELPDIAAPLWEWYLDLAERRGSNGFSQAPLSWQDLEAWQRMSGLELLEHERRWLFDLDRCYFEDLAEAAAAKAPPPGRKKGGPA